MSITISGPLADRITALARLRGLSTDSLLSATVASYLRSLPPEEISRSYEAAYAERTPSQPASLSPAQIAEIDRQLAHGDW